MMSGSLVWAAYLAKISVSAPVSGAKNVALWALQILTAAAFLLAGFGALSGYPMMVATFDKVGIGQWFRYVTGGIEVTSALLLLIPALTPLGAGLLVCTMTGAVLFVGEGAMFSIFNCTIAGNRVTKTARRLRPRRYPSGAS